MYTLDLAEIMKPKGITVNCLDPGTVNTKMLIAGELGGLASSHIAHCSLAGDNLHCSECRAACSWYAASAQQKHMLLSVPTWSHRHVVSQVWLLL